MRAREPGDLIVHAEPANPLADQRDNPEARRVARPLDLSEALKTARDEARKQSQRYRRAGRPKESPSDQERLVRKIWMRGQYGVTDDPAVGLLLCLLGGELLHTGQERGVDSLVGIDGSLQEMEVRRGVLLILHPGPSRLHGREQLLFLRP